VQNENTGRSEDARKVRSFTGRQNQKQREKSWGGKRSRQGEEGCSGLFGLGGRFIKKKLRLLPCGSSKEKRRKWGRANQTKKKKKKRGVMRGEG